jgi:hypothetical protein
MGGVNYNLPVLNQFNTFTNQMVIDTASSTTAALRVTQRGAGNAITVEDSTTPDATSFVVDQFGKVGIGVAPSATAALKVDTNGIMFGDGTTQTTAATGGGGFVPGSGNLELGDFYVKAANSSYSAKMSPTQCIISVGSATIGTIKYTSDQGYSSYSASRLTYSDDGSGNAYVSSEAGNVVGAEQMRGYFFDYSNPTIIDNNYSLTASGGLEISSSAGIIRYKADSIQFIDGSVQTTAFTTPGIPDAPSDGNYYVRKDGAWIACTVVSIYDSNTSTSYNCLTV